MASVVRYFGYGREAVFGTPVEATHHIDMASSTLDTPPGQDIVYEGSLGRGLNIARPGYYVPAGNVVSAMDLQTLGLFLRHTLGGYRFTAATPPAQPLPAHEMWMQAGNVLPSFTARVGKDHFEHVFAGTVVNSLELRVAGELLMATLDVLAQKDSRAALLAVPDLLIPADYPLAFHEVRARMGPVGGPLSNIWASVKELSLSLENNLSPERGRSIGSRFAARLLAEAFSCTLSLSLFFEGTTWLEDYWGTSTGPSPGPHTVVEKSLEITLDGGTFGSCTILLPRARLSSIQIQPSGRGEIVQPAEITAFQATVTLLAPPTVSSPILVTLRHAQPSMV